MTSLSGGALASHCFIPHYSRSWEMFRKRDDISRGNGANKNVIELITAKKMTPTAWFFLFGEEVAVLRPVALCVLSQLSTFAECEEWFSLFGAVNRKNCMSIKTLAKIASVAYSLHSVRWAKKQKEITSMEILRIVFIRVNTTASSVLLGSSKAMDRMLGKK